MLRGELKTIHTLWYAGTRQRYIPHSYHRVAMVTTRCHGYYHVATRNESLVTHSNGPCTYTSMVCSDTDNRHTRHIPTHFQQTILHLRKGAEPGYAYSLLLLLLRQFHSSQMSRPQTLCYSCNPASNTEEEVRVKYVCMYLLYPKRDDSTRSSSQTECLVLPACMHMYVFH